MRGRGAPGGQSQGGVGGVLPPSPCLQPGGISSVSGFWPRSPGPTASPAEGASLCDPAGGASCLTLPRARSTPAPPFALVDKATGTSPSSQNVKAQNLREGGHPPSPTSPSLQVTPLPPPQVPPTLALGSCCDPDSHTDAGHACEAAWGSLSRAPGFRPGLSFPGGGWIHWSRVSVGVEGPLRHSGWAWVCPL